MLSRGCPHRHRHSYNTAILRAQRAISSSKYRNALATRAPSTAAANANRVPLNFHLSSQGENGSDEGEKTANNTAADLAHRFRTTPLTSFLSTPPTYTLLPSPIQSITPPRQYKSLEPLNSLDETQKYYFARSPVHQSIAVIDACLANLYDVPRARAMFNRMREGWRGHPLLEVRLYNVVLRAYLQRAYHPRTANLPARTEREGEGGEGVMGERESFLNEFWELYDVLIEGSEVEPNASTFALALIAHIRSTISSSSSSSPLESSLESPSSSSSHRRSKPSSSLLRNALIRTPSEIIRQALERKIPILEVLLDHSLNLLGNSSFVPAPLQVAKPDADADASQFGREEVDEVDPFDSNSERSTPPQTSTQPTPPQTPPPQIQILSLLSRTAVEMGNIDLINELGTIESVLGLAGSSGEDGSGNHPSFSSSLWRGGIMMGEEFKDEDPLRDVPEIKPVLKRKFGPDGDHSGGSGSGAGARRTGAGTGAGGEDGGMGLGEGSIPFNLALLRSRLSSSERTRRLLVKAQAQGQDSSSPSSHPSTPGDDLLAQAEAHLSSSSDPSDQLQGQQTPTRTTLNTTPHFRQTQLETLTYDIAGRRMQHEADALKDAGEFGMLGMKARPIRAMMYQWHQELQSVLVERLAELEKEEEKGWKQLEKLGYDRMWVGGTHRVKKDATHPLLSLLPPSSLSLLTIQELLRLQGSGGIDTGMKTTRAVLAIGRAVELEWNVVMRKEAGNVMVLDDLEVPRVGEKVGRGSQNDLSGDGRDGAVEMGGGEATSTSNETELNEGIGMENGEATSTSTETETETELNGGIAMENGEANSTSTSTSTSNESSAVEASKHQGYEPTPAFFTPAHEEHAFATLYANRIRHRKLMEIDERWNWSSEWTQVIRAKVGSFLVDALMSVARVEVRRMKSPGEIVSSGAAIEGDEERDYHSELHPAFFHSYDYVRGHKLGVIRLHPRVAEQMSREPSGERLHARHLPMLVRPKPWVSHDLGGYLINKTSAMRYKDSHEQKLYMQEASNSGNLELVYSGLDVLGATPWRVNRAIFDVVLKVWNSGKGLGKIPPEMLDLEEPPKPDLDDPTARSVYLQRMNQIHVARANNHSDRCNVNYKLEVARAFLADTFYFPHNLDFRGRAYPLPPHLNHIGDDLSRGLLQFGESRALGGEGLRWLKIHLAGLYGYDKASFSERVTWVEERLDDIRDSVKDPLNGKRWWTRADDPWQCLATCMELINALDSGNPHSFQSFLPIHQDGTCNGLQHYAALGGDMDGARQVNLVEGDRPSDVYSHVAGRVETMIEVDAEKGDRLALMCKGKISRKVVKQTVMTTVYGVTFVGAREQIMRQLKERGEWAIEDLWDLSSYIAKKVIAAIGDLFEGAQGIMSWLTLSARLIAKSLPEDRARELNLLPASLPTGRRVKRMVMEQMSTVIWTTPLGLPVVQPYRRERRKQIVTSLQSVYLSDPNEPTEVNVSKQTSAFPPNFIHSLDATHMMLTALECRASDITFASVHDSYWTHASNIGKMSEIIRDTFIALHSSDVLSKLDEEFRTRYAKHKIPISSLKNRMAGLLKTLGIEKPQRRRVMTKHGPTTGITREELLKALRGEVELPPEFDPALPAQTRRRAKLKAMKAETGEEVAEDGEEEKVDDQDGEAFDDLFEESEDEMDSVKAEAVAEAEQIFQERFIDLVQLLPPLPKNGQFDVTNIKRSQYFFS